MIRADKYRVKFKFLLPIIAAAFLAGCAHNLPQGPRTLTSDLYPNEITRTEYYRELAWGYDREGKIPEAIELYRLSLMHDPKNIKARIQLSDSFRKEKIDHLASAQLSEVLRLDPTNETALRKLGELYLDTQIYSKAMAVYTELLRINPADEKSMWATYYINKLDKKYDVALTVLSKIEVAFASESMQLTVSSEKASIYRFQKNWLKEKKYLITANNLQPNYFTHVTLLADSYFRFKEWPEAAEILQRFTDTNDFNFEISEKLAFVSLQTQAYDVALREYYKQRPFTFDPFMTNMKIAHTYFLMKDYKLAEEKYLFLLDARDDDEAKYFLSKVYQLTDREEQSVTLLAQLGPISEYYGESQMEIADVQKKNGQIDEAVNRLRKAHTKRPDLLVLYKGYADMLIQNNRYVESVALLEQGIGFHPDDEELRFKLAFVHYRLNNQKSFKKQLTKAMEINPLNAEIYSGLAELWYVKGKKASDVEYFVTKAMNLKSKNKNLKPLLAWALLEQNKAVEAIAIFEEYYEENPQEYFYVKSLADIYRYGRVSTKAEQFQNVATALGADSVLKGRLLDRMLKEPAVLDPSEQNKSRMPASMENY